MKNQPGKLSLNLGFLKGITRQLRLIARLMADNRVNPLLKLLPVGAVIYLIVPTDLMPFLPFDDAAVLWLGGSLFIEFCPPEIVKEHLRILDGESISGPESAAGIPPADVVDAEFHDVSGKQD